MYLDIARIAHSLSEVKDPNAEKFYDLLMREFIVVESKHELSPRDIKERYDINFKSYMKERLGRELGYAIIDNAQACDYEESSERFRLRALVLKVR